MSSSEPIIDSILQTDLYKLTQQWAVIQKFPATEVHYRFINRDSRKFTVEMVDEINEQISLMAELKLTNAERQFLYDSCPFLPAAYVDFLAGYRYEPKEVSTFISCCGEFAIEICGWWHRAILWEVPVMAIVSEVYNKYSGNTPTGAQMHDFRRRTFNKGLALHDVTYADFGTRRRLSCDSQKAMLQVLKYQGIMGTSNVKMAMDFNLKPIGTQAHEWYMAHGAMYGYKAATKMALDNWVDVYQGSLGIALTDTYTSDVFFNSFGLKHAKLFDGVRHDSGNPFQFADKAIEHYKKLGIDPMSKTIVFSDGLNVEKVQNIEDFCKGHIKTSYGIGTFLTNDFPNVKPLNIVIKLHAADGNWCVKLSDEVGKVTGNPEEVALCKRTLDV
jgi:nicotinate phosphoribosyltransferase